MALLALTRAPELWHRGVLAMGFYDPARHMWRYWSGGEWCARALDCGFPAERSAWEGVEFGCDGIETGTDSHRLAATWARAEQQAAAR